MAKKNKMSAEDKRNYAKQIDANFKKFLGEVKGKFVKALEEQTAPWQKPWIPMIPHNFTTHNEYSGANIISLSLILSLECYIKNIPYDPRFCTTKAAFVNHFKVKDLGNKYYAYFPYTKLVPADPEKIKDLENWEYFMDEEKTIPAICLQLTKKHVLYNVSNLESDKIPSYDEYWVDNEKTKEWNKGDKIEEMINILGIKIVSAGSRAAYDPEEDVIFIPPKATFNSEEAYYSTLLHEISHWTGTRLKRELSTNKNSVAYAKEEVIAEMSAYALSCYFGVRDFRTEAERSQSYDYTKSWLSSFNKEEKIKAYDEATKAVNKIYRFLTKDLSKPELEQTTEESISPEDFAPVEEDDCISPFM